MQNAAVVVTSVVLAVAVSVGVQIALEPDPAQARDAPAVAPDELAALRASLARVEARQGDLDAGLDGLRSELAAGPGRGPRVAVGELEAAVARVLASRGLGDAPPGDGAQGDRSSGDGEGTDVASAPVQDLVAQLLAGEGFDLASAALWQEVREAGRMDEVLAAFEARAEADPTNPAVQVELGEAYINKIAEVGNGPMAGVFAGKADAAFDLALELDPNHWDARFNKAVALSFWPPVFGKQSAAIAHFEVLVGQQAALPPEPQHAQTHLLLGNMYMQIGETDKALAAWKAGLAIFPGDEDLASQIALTEDK